MAKKKRSRRSTTKGKAPEAQSIPKALLRYPKPVAEALGPLTVNERRFVIAYCSECRGNATLSVQRAGLTNEGQSYMARAVRGSQLLQQTNIRRAVEAWMQAYAMTAVEATWRVKDMADINPAPFFEITPPTPAQNGNQADPGGQLRFKERIDPEDWEAFNHWIKVLEMDPKTGRVTRIELHDRQVAQREINKILKLYSEQPMFSFNLFLQQLSDDQLLRELSQLRSEEPGSDEGEAPPQVGSKRRPPRLPSGAPVAVVDPPT